MSVQSPELKFVTEQCLREWKASNANFKLPDPVPMSRFLYELCWTVVRGDLAFQRCKVALDSAGFSEEQEEDMGSIFADIIAHMGQDLTLPGEYRIRLVKMAKWLVESSLVPPRLLQERCEEEFLWEAELSKIKAQDLKAKEVRVNTRLLYQQTKFNLLREESEGYAKLVTLLCQGGLDAMTKNTSMATISIIKSLIGHFDLDPNRVFDIVLECFELHPNNTVFYNLIPLFPKSHAAQVLGFKFQYYQRLEVNTPVPSGLYNLTALLVKAEFIDLNSIYAHLLPHDDEAFEHYDAYVAKRFDEANKIGKINLAATGKDLMDDEKQDVAIDLFTALDMESEATTGRASETEKNQSLGLLIGFLSVCDWHHAQILFDRLSHLNPAEHIQICTGLFRLIEKTISTAHTTVYQTHLQSTGKSNPDVMEITVFSTQSSVDLPRELFQMLAAVGPYLHRDTVLLQKVCRVLRAHLLSAQDEGASLRINAHESSDFKSQDLRLRAKEARIRVEEALGSCLLPSLQLIPANPAVGQQIWEVLSLLPYEVRYRLYGEWEKVNEPNPMILAARQIAKLDTRRILKRLAKENLKQLGRMVAKLAHANPMTVLRTIIHQIEAYKDMIAPVVDAFKYLTQLEYDVLEYVVIERLAHGGREKVKDDGLNLSDWLQSLASFWGHLCKKYPSMELRGLFQYLVNQLKRGIGTELVLLQELIQQMANVQYTENMTEEQLDSMAGSETLRYQATLFGMSRNNKADKSGVCFEGQTTNMSRNNKALSKSTSRLRESLLPKEEPKLAIPLLLLIAQHRSMVVINADAPYIKMVSEQFDRCHGTLLQYVEFLSCAITPSAAYAQLIPTIDDLFHKYHLDPEVVFLVYRPVMRLFKCSSAPEVFWPVDVTESNALNEDNESESSSCLSSFVLDLGLPHKTIIWSDLLEMVRSMLPLRAWNSLSPDLYATFWGLTLYDIYVPRSRYESEIVKQRAAIKALEELSDNSSIAITKRKKDKERIQEVLERLISEYQKHDQHVASVHARLSREKDKWLSSCPDTLKINMEFLQRCIFPRCIFSMPDSLYCAMFVHTLHSLGTPFFNTVNHIDVLICKTLQPMICCCTEFEAGRLGRFLYETLKMAYHWKSDESIYERECGNMPGFAVYYRYPNSQRVTFTQFIRVHWKWNGRITRLLVQCLESSEYMEIRNALIMLTKISGVFPVTRKSGINLEKRVAKIKGEEREDLKVLATGVAAALAARKSSWVSDDEFSMGHVDSRPAPSPAKTFSSNPGNTPNGSTDQIARAKSTDRYESSIVLKSDIAHQKQRGTSSSNGPLDQSIIPSSNIPPRPSGSQKNTDEVSKVTAEVAPKAAGDTETRPHLKRSVQTLGKQAKQEYVKEDARSGKSISRAVNQQSSADKDSSTHPSEGRQGGGETSSAAATNGSIVPSSGKVSTSSARTTHDMHNNQSRVDSGANKPSDDIMEAEVSRTNSAKPYSSLPDDSITKQQKKIALSDEQDRVGKRRKGDTEGKDGEGLESRVSDKVRNLETRSLDKAHAFDHDKTREDKSKDRSVDRYDKDQKEKLDRSDKNHVEDLEKSRERSVEGHGRERSIERMPERGTDRSLDRTIDKVWDERNKDDRSKTRHIETPMERLHADERFHGQSLPPPPPLPPSFLSQSISGSRRDEDADRRVGTSRHIQRLSPRHDDKERRRSEENMLTTQEDTKRRREDDFRERKRDDRDGPSTKVEEREKDKGNALKDDMDSGTASKRRKMRRDYTSSTEAGEISPVAPHPPPLLAIGTTQTFDARERNDRKGAISQHRTAYMDEPGQRMHGKETVSKINRREADQIHEREWEEDKRQRTEAKRKHRK